MCFFFHSQSFSISQIRKDFFGLFLSEIWMEWKSIFNVLFIYLSFIYNRSITFIKNGIPITALYHSYSKRSTLTLTFHYYRSIINSKYLFKSKHIRGMAIILLFFLTSFCCWLTGLGYPAISSLYLKPTRSTSLTMIFWRISYLGIRYPQGLWNCLFFWVIATLLAIFLALCHPLTIHNPSKAILYSNIYIKPNLIAFRTGTQSKHRKYQT